MIDRAYVNYGKYLQEYAPLLVKVIKAARKTSPKGANYIDQTLPSLMNLLALGLEFGSAKIVELGTGLGCGAAVWALIAERHGRKVLTFDRKKSQFESFRPRLRTIGIPVDRVTVTQQHIKKLNWTEILSGDRVLLFVDAHDTPKFSVMKDVIQKALPILRKKPHLVVLHDFFFRGVDEYGHDHSYLPPHFRGLEKRTRYPYWEGGFYGRDEVRVLLEWLKTQPELRIHYADAEILQHNVHARLRAAGCRGDWIPSESSWSSVSYLRKREGHRD